MRDRFLAREVRENLGFDADALCAYVDQHQMMTEFRRALFSRVVPTVKDIGLWGDEVQRTDERMGVLDFQGLDIDELSDNDERIAAEMEELLAARAEGRPVATTGSRAAEMATTIAAGDEGSSEGAQGSDTTT